MTVLGSRDWRAIEGTNFAGGDRKLVVTGEVELSRFNDVPTLDEAVPQGIVAEILLLDLSSTSHGDVGGDANKWEPVTFEKSVEEDQYLSAEIRGQGAVEVEKLIS